MDWEKRSSETVLSGLSSDEIKRKLDEFIPYDTRSKEVFQKVMAETHTELMEFAKALGADVAEQLKLRQKNIDQIKDPATRESLRDFNPEY